MKKRIFSILLVLCLLGAMVTAESGLLSKVEAKTTMKYGLTVDKNGNFQLNGSAFYGYGFNATSGNIWTDPFDDTFENCIQICKKYEIPFVRVPLTYGTIEEFQRFEEGSELMFETGKRMLDMAKEAGIGVIVWICNSQRYTSMLGEKASSQGDMNSKSMAFMKKWVAKFVETYKDHPALWGWEIRNEGNLTADLTVTAETYNSYIAQVYGESVGEVNGWDSASSESFMILNREVAKEIRKQDSYRMISNGNAVMRTSAYHLHQASQNRDKSTNVWTVDWTRDTVAQFKEMNLYFTPEPVDTISLHIGMPGLMDDEYSKNGVFAYPLSDQTLDYKQFLQAYVDLAKENKKGFYYGEFGAMGVNALELDPDMVKKLLPRNLQTMVECGVQLASMWQRIGNNAYEYIVDEGNMSYIFSELQKTNEKFKKMGLQKTDEYWAAVAKQEANATTKPSKTNADTTTTTSSLTNTVDVSKFMTSVSTKLTISANDNTITIEKPVTFDVFQRSLAFRTGYTMKVLDTDGASVTADDAAVDSNYVVEVFDPNGTKLVTFTVKTQSADSSATTVKDSTASTAVNGGESEGNNGWVLWVVIAAATVLLAVGGFLLYWFVLRNKN